MKTHLRLMAVTAAILGLGVEPAAALQSPSPDVAAVLDLLPGTLAKSARVTVPSEGGPIVVREGDGPLECIGDQPGDAVFAVQCYHRTLAPFVAHEAVLSAQGVSGSAFRERVCRDVEAGAVALPDRGYLMTASGARPGPTRLPDSVMVYHFLYLPFATEASVGLPASEVAPGQPWLHHAGSCSAHLMWSETRRVVAR